MWLRSPQCPGQFLEKQATEFSNFVDSLSKRGNKRREQEGMSGSDSSQEVSTVLAVALTGRLTHKSHVEDVQHGSFNEPAIKSRIKNIPECLCLTCSPLCLLTLPCLQKQKEESRAQSRQLRYTSLQTEPKDLDSQGQFPNPQPSIILILEP